MNAPRYWQPLTERAVGEVAIDSPQVVLLAKQDGIAPEEAKRRLDEWHRTHRYFRNDRYQVEVGEGEIVDEAPGSTNESVAVTHLNVRRTDGAPIHDWRDLQQIKNELIGPECEAVELYPAESRKVDGANKFHLWGFRDQTFRFPIGFKDRDVMDGDMKATTIPGMRQRPL